MLQRVLYVDDDDALTELAELVLDAAGIELLACNSGHEAVLLAADFKPELVLLDREMPEMDGVATLNALRDQALMTDVPFVFVTAETDPDIVAELRATGAVEVMAKPISPTALANQLQTIYATHS